MPLHYAGKCRAFVFDRQNQKLQRGLVVTDKSERVYHYAENLMHEVGIIAHSCGVSEPRQLNRSHCRVVGTDGLSMPLEKLYPYPKVAKLPENA